MAYLSHPLTANQVSYLAGLYEAEGAFIPGSPSKPRVPIVILGMTDEDVVKRVGELLHVAVLKVKPGSERWKPVYRAHLNGGRAVSFMNLLQDYMGERRRVQIQAAIDCYKPYYNYHHDTYERVEEGTEDLDRYWLAGYFEGEGYFTVIQDTKPYGTYFYPLAVVSSTDYDVLERVREIMHTRYGVNVGVREPKQRQNRKVTYRIQVVGRGAKKIMEDLYQLMGQRRQVKIMELLEGSNKID